MRSNITPSPAPTSQLTSLGARNVVLRFSNTTIVVSKPSLGTDVDHPLSPLRSDVHEKALQWAGSSSKKSYQIPKNFNVSGFIPNRNTPWGLS
jgi:hypothetical protein